MTDLMNDALAKLDALEVVPGASMVHGDALEAMSALPTASVDLVCVDPPYMLSNGGTTVSSGKRVAVSKGTWDESAGVRKDFEFHRRWLRLCQRVLKPEGTIWVFGTHHCAYSVGFAMQLSGWRMLNTVTWEKPNPPPNIGTRCLTHSTESIIWASPNQDEPQRHVFNYDDAKAETGKQMKDVWRGTSPAADEKLLGKHPTQKPLWLLQRVVDLSTAPGALVLDCFAGSATTGIAALASGRRFLGIESDADHFALAVGRLRSAI